MQGFCTKRPYFAAFLLRLLRCVGTLPGKGIHLPLEQHIYVLSIEGMVATPKVAVNCLTVAVLVDFFFFNCLQFFSNLEGCWLITFRQGTTNSSPPKRRRSRAITFEDGRYRSQHNASHLDHGCRYSV